MNRILLIALAGFGLLCPRGAELDRDFLPRFTWMEGPYMRKVRIAVQVDGKILAGGQISACNGRPVKRIVRFEKNGAIDESFQAPDGIREVQDFTLGQDGWIYVRGLFEFDGRTSRLDRISFEGKRDVHFHGLGMTSGFAVANDGAITFSGNFTAYQGATAYLARLLPSGGIDPSFKPETRPSSMLSLCGGGVYLLPEGKLLVAGLFPGIGPHSISIQRIFTDGKRDLSFAARGVVIGSIVFDAHIQQNGQIVFTDNNWDGVKRLNVDGSADEAFHQQARVSARLTVLRCAVAPDYRIYAVSGVDAGGESTPQLNRFTRDGTLDETFQQGRGPTEWEPASYTFMETVVESNGGLLVVGNFRKFDGVECSGLVRLKTGLLKTIVMNEFKNGKVRLGCVGNDGGLVIEQTANLKDWTEGASGEFYQSRAEVILEPGSEGSRFYRIH